MSTVKNAVSLHRYRTEARSRRHIIGSSDVIVKTIQRIRKLAVLNETILIRGESDSGKELVSNNLHLLSPRATAPIH
jgi:transcriptional regulator with PAS, ATPase and Fis domain